jgi:uncharacterized protein (DUF342 family)
VRAGGDIIITKGAMGKMQVEDCRLIANGNIFIQHGQELDIIAGKDVNVSKQLAYSKVKCRGSLIVGDPDKPMGTLFANNISCFKTVKAGTVGAVSGSILNVDYSEGYNLLVNRSEALNELLKTITEQNADSEIKVSMIKNKIIPESLMNKLKSLDDELESQRVLLTWVRDAAHELTEKRESYIQNARVVANKELFPGVTVRLNKKIWKGEKECVPCRIVFDDGNWDYQPLIN